MTALPVLAHGRPAMPCPALPCPALPCPALPCFPYPAVQDLYECAGSAVVRPELHVCLHDPLPPGCACPSSWGKYVSLCASMLGLVCTVDIDTNEAQI